MANPEKHNAEVWKKIQGLESEILKLKSTILSLDSVEPVTLSKANGDMRAARMAQFAEADKLKLAVESAVKNELKKKSK